MIRIEDKVYFDTDCLSAFLWVNEFLSLVQLFGSNNIILPREVYKEIIQVGKFKPVINGYISKKLISVVDMNLTDPEMKVFRKIMFSDPHYKKFGYGEASVISYAVCNSKKMASNNLSDVASYIKEYELLNYTVPDIIDMMVAEGIKDVHEADIMWSGIYNRGVYLPTDSYIKYKKAMR